MELILEEIKKILQNSKEVWHPESIDIYKDTEPKLWCVWFMVEYPDNQIQNQIIDIREGDSFISHKYLTNMGLTHKTAKKIKNKVDNMLEVLV